MESDDFLSRTLDVLPELVDDVDMLLFFFVIGAGLGCCFCTGAANVATVGKAGSATGDGVSVAATVGCGGRTGTVLTILGGGFSKPGGGEVTSIVQENI